MISMGLAGGVYFSALSSRLISTCSTSTSSMATSGRSRGTRVVTRRAPSCLAKRPSALQRQRRLGRERLELVQPLGLVHGVTIGGTHAEDADGPGGADQRHVEGGRAGQRARAEPGRLAVLVHPAAHAELVGVHVE